MDAMSAAMEADPDVLAPPCVELMAMATPMPMLVLVLLPTCVPEPVPVPTPAAEALPVLAADAIIGRSWASC